MQTCMTTACLRTATERSQRQTQKESQPNPQIPTPCNRTLRCSETLQQANAVMSRHQNCSISAAPGTKSRNFREFWSKSIRSRLGAADYRQSRSRSPCEDGIARCSTGWRALKLTCLTCQTPQPERVRLQSRSQPRALQWMELSKVIELLCFFFDSIVLVSTQRIAILRDI